MPSNREKAILITELSAHQGDPAITTLLSLLDILILEAREANDTSEGPSLYRNQGKIEGYKELKDTIVRGLPGSHNM